MYFSKKKKRTGRENNEKQETMQLPSIFGQLRKRVFTLEKGSR